VLPAVCCVLSVVSCVLGVVCCVLGVVCCVLCVVCCVLWSCCVLLFTCLFVPWFACLLVSLFFKGLHSTSCPSENQVDGLPLVSHSKTYGQLVYLFLKILILKCKVLPKVAAVFDCDAQ